MSFIYGPGGAPFSSLGVLAIAGNTGIASIDPITLTGSTSGAYFTGAASTMTESINYVSLPTTTSTVGQIYLNGSRFFHGYGTTNVLLGTNAGNFTNNSSNMVGIGVQTLQNATGGGSFNNNDSIAIGTQALQSLTTSCNDNIGIGYRAAYQLTASCNNAIYIGHNVCSDAGTTVQSNNVFGANAMTGASKTSSTNNQIFGANAGQSLTTGDSNAFLGYQSGNGVSTGSSNISINGGNVGDVSNRLVIGAGTGTGTQQLNEAFIHGIRGITTVNNNAIAVLVDSAGQLGTVSSSIRYKENVSDMGDVSEPIMNLRPVTFDFIGKPSHKRQVGLIAEEVELIMPSLVAYNQDKEAESVKYHDLSVLLLNELMKLLKEIDVLKNELAQQI